MIETYCYVYNKHLNDLGIETDDKKVRVSFSKEQVSAYREYIDDNETEINKENIYVYLKSGESFLINISYNGFKKIME